jgi:hypothetical protein
LHRNTDDTHYTDWGVVHMKNYSASEAATELGTDGRTLRRFLRTADSGFTPVGSGGSYSFSTGDMPKLKSAFEKWNTRPTRTVNKKNTEGGVVIEDRPGLSATVIHSRLRTDREAVAKLSRERVDRLEAALRSKGLHISQMKDREGWKATANA